MHVLVLALGAVLLTSLVPAHAQPAGQSAAAIAARPLHEAPFELVGGHIYLQVRVNGSAPRLFILDSGAPDSYLGRELAQTAGAQLRGSIGVTGAGQGRHIAALAHGVTYDVGGARFRDDRSVAPGPDFFVPLQNAFGRKFDGLLGYDFLRGYVVELDYLAGLMRLYEPKSYRYSGPGATLLMVLRDRKPYVSGLITPRHGQPILSNLHQDIGFGGALGLSGNFVAAAGIERLASGTIESSSVGAGGVVKERVGRVANLQLGRFSLTEPITSFELRQGRGVRSDSDGRIGGGVLRRFKVVLDYSRRQVMLEPNRAFAEPFATDMSGLRLRAVPPEFDTSAVAGVRPDSPAARAGMLEGDLLLAVDGTPITQLPLEAVRGMLRRNGEERRIRFSRAGEVREVRFTLQRAV